MLSEPVTWKVSGYTKAGHKRATCTVQATSKEDAIRKANRKHGLNPEYTEARRLDDDTPHG